MIDGVDLEVLESETGVPLAELCGDVINQSISEGLLVKPLPNWIRLSDRGVLFADTIASRLLG